MVVQALRSEILTGRYRLVAPSQAALSPSPSSVAQQSPVNQCQTVTPKNWELIEGSHQT